MLIRLAVPTPLRRSFDYRYKGTAPAVGSRVVVPFGRQKLTAVVLSHPDSSQVPSSKLKYIDKVIDSEPLLPSVLFKLIRFAADYYQHPIGEVFANCLPTLLNKGEPAKLEPEWQWSLTPSGEDAIPKIRSNAVKQKQLFQLCLEHNGVLTEQVLGLHDFIPSYLKTFEEKGWLVRSEQKPSQVVYEPEAGYDTENVTLTSEQEDAVDSIRPHFGSFKGFLLDGVTGSGKTEVYLQLIREALSRQQQVLMLVPEIGLTPQTVKRLERRFNVPIAMLHSGLTDKQRLNIWLKARAGQISIVIGTRSALFTPLAKPGLIIVDEEHDLSYKQQEGFRYSARDLAIVRAQYEQTPIVLGSATPSMESLHNVEQGKLSLLRLTKRAGEAKPPHIKVLDVRQRHLNQGLSQPLIDNMRKHLAQNQQCMIFLNRRGFAPTLICHECGWIADCQRCDRHMTYHQRFKRLHCHHCDKQVFMPKRCPECQSPQLNPVGLGTERLEEALKEIFPDKSVARIDRDSTRRKDSMQNFVEAIKNNEIDILIGTQMLAKGHHFPKLSLVGVVDTDGCLFSADFRATERTAQLLTQVAGRAGRSKGIKGEVVIQSHHPDHPLLVNLFTQDYQTLSRNILAERQEAQLPPYTAMAIFRAEANTLEMPMTFLNDVKQQLKHTGLSVYGPYPAPMPKRAGKMRAQLMVQHAQRKRLQQALSPITPTLEQLPSSRKVRWSLDIDPQEVF
ncbi:primosomal protein N' [Kangiella spongicola]|uniref:Replication restart protein PriA n=1 Tax=Kangiella spongicola TaxID=796379 RepID=A0A318D413_9GAMM|nr:primosomal protein N' [Kangiella spongicola]PXF63970.1 primosomal protein N' [Kangiella spongicola]